MNEQTQAILAGLARHALTGVAGSLVTVGAIQSGQKEQFLTIASGIVVWAVGFAWSWWQKSGQAKVAALLKKLTTRTPAQAASITTAAAVTAAQALPAGSAVTKGLP
jgi:hypothetical protein